MSLNETQQRQWERFRETMAAKENQIKDCARLCKTHWPDDCRRILKAADELLDHTFLFQLPWDMEQTREPVTFPETINWRLTFHEDPEFVFQMNRHRYWICLGQAYGLTGDEGYADELVYQMLDWMEKEPWTEETAALTWRTLDAGLRADYWVRAMALCAHSPAVTEEVVQQFFNGLEVHGKRLFENPNTGFSKKSNWGVMEYAGLYLLGFILENAEYVEKARRYLKIGLHSQIMDDGMQWEMSSMYHNEVVMAYLEVMRIAHIWNDQPFTQEEMAVIEKMAYLTLALQTPSGCQPMTGDSDDTDVRDLLSQAALLLKNGQLKTGAFPLLDYEGIWMFGPEGFEEYRNMEAKELKTGLEKFFCSGQAVMRTGWGKDSCWLYFVNGPLGGGHGHQDKLHMGLWLDGEEVLTDSGRYTYKDVSKRYLLKSAKAHNVPMLKGIEYADSKDTWTYEALPQSAPNQIWKKGEYLFIEGAHEGYMDRKILVKRRIVAVSFDIFVISDTFLGAMPEEIIQSFHFGETIGLSLTGERAEGKGEKCQFVIKAFSEGKEASAELGKSPISRHYNQLEERASLRIAGRNTRTLTSFLVRRQGDELADITPEPVYSAVRGRTVRVQEAEGYVITAKGRKTGLVFLHQEAGNGTDYNGIQGVYGLGRTMVCDLSQKPDHMTVLQW